MKEGAALSRMPAGVSLAARASVTTGSANEVDLSIGYALAAYCILAVAKE
jgi:hypothetical protein